LDRPAQDQLTPVLAQLRHDVRAVAAAGIAAVSPAVLVPAALRGVAADVADAPGPLAVAAVGKAAAAMHRAFTALVPAPADRTLAVGPVRPDDWSGGTWITGGHPFATDGSVEAGRRALDLAGQVAADGRLILLLSGGASALMAAPAYGISLAVKQQTARTLMTSGAAITELNAVRKHLSAVKGGRLAAACRGRVITLAISDVVGDDLSVIGSGPGVPDPSTWRDMRDALHAFGGAAHDPAVLAVADAGCAGRLPETPKPGDAAIARSRAHVIGGRREAMAGAAAAAEALGYHAVVHDAAVVGEARSAAAAWWRETAAPHLGAGRRVAVISSGETTVRVRGQGRGGRNQEFALAVAGELASVAAAALASVGTDGVDGPTDAGGAFADTTTTARAAGLGLAAADTWLDRNDSYAYFARLGDLWQPGPTGTNVGDLQVMLIAPA
jgi:glycerate 2-kinase